MGYLIKDEKYKDYTIRLEYDEIPSSPREWENLGTFYSNHRDYNPDGHSIDKLVEMFPPRNRNEFINRDALSREYVWINVYAYIHTSITLSTSPFNDSWDSGLFAIYAISKEKVRREYNKKVISKQLRENIEEYLTSEVRIYSQYLKGNVYGYIIEDPDGDEVNSCWGFYEQDDCLDEAKRMVDWYIECEEREAEERYNTIKDSLTQLVGKTFVYDLTAYQITLDMFNFPVIQSAKLIKNQMPKCFGDPLNIKDLDKEVQKIFIASL